MTTIDRLRPARNPGSERGAALLIVLWLSVLLATILLAVSVLVQAQLRGARIDRERLQSDEVLMSAMDVVAFDTALIGRTALQDLPRTIRVGESSVTVSLAPAHHILDINMANDEDWQALFIRTGESPAVARRLADRILDWRDPDTTPRDFGLETNPSQGNAVAMNGNRPFLSVGELIQVRGMTQAKLACLRPHLTALGGTPLPELDDLAGRESGTMDGARVAFSATRRRPNGVVDEMTALALFREQHRRPFHWVSFGDDRPPRGECASAQSIG
jgi:general secretion pathway protein K